MPAWTASYTWDLHDRSLSDQTTEATVTTTWDDPSRSRTISVDYGPFTKSWSQRTDSADRVSSLTLPDGTDDARYLEELEQHLPAVIAAARADVVFYLAGVACVLAAVRGGT